MKNIRVFLLFIGISAFNPNYINGSVVDNVDYLTKESSDTVVVNFEYGENISPTATWKNIYAIWMEDTTTNFIQNIFICTKLIFTTGLTPNALPYWKINKFPISSGSEIDAVTGATKANTNFSVSAILKDSNVRKFDLFFEVDRYFEPNDWFSTDQPGLLYSIPINLDDTTTNYELKPIGWTPSALMENIIPNTPKGKLQKEMKYITNHKVGSSFGDADERSSTKMVKKITAVLKKSDTHNFITGWNIMSMNVIPDNKNLMTILQPLIDAGKLKKVMDETGKVIENRGGFGGWVNSIGDMQNTEGYKINLLSPGTLKVQGLPVSLPFEIPLREGWNIISWPTAGEQNGMDVFQSLIDQGKLKKVMDEKGNVIENRGAFGGWVNSIVNLKPGEGYKVNVLTDCVLTINDSGPKSEMIQEKQAISAHFIPAYKGNGFDHMNICLVNIDKSGLMEGDEIGVFDGNICVGSAKISNLQSLIVNQNSIGIPVSAADGIEDKNGYSQGNQITLKLFRNGKEYPLTIQPLNQSKTVFEKGESLFAQVDLATGIKGIKGSNMAKINCSPNPFSDEVNIEINLEADAQVQVEVLNQLGQLVKMITTKKQLTGGLHKFEWDGRNTGNGEVAPGIYHLRIEIDDSIVHRKIVLSK